MPIDTVRGRIEIAIVYVACGSGGLAIRELYQAIKLLDTSDVPGRWWIEGKGVMSYDHQGRIIPDPTREELDVIDR